MKKSFLLWVCSSIFFLSAKTQVGINTTGASANSSAILDVTSNTKGMLIPRLTTTERTAITSPATGLLVYDISLSLFYYYNGTVWTAISAPVSGWSPTGNSGTTSGIHFLGTTDNQSLDINTNNILHTRINTTGQIEVLNTGNSVFLGMNAGKADDINNRRNVAVGSVSLSLNTTGTANTAVGSGALQNATASYNTAVGTGALKANTAGIYNTSLGTSSSNQGAALNYNVVLGYLSLFNSTNGTKNVAVGANALLNGTSGNENIAIGANALFNNTSHYNVGVGLNALTGNTTGTYNLALGYNANVAASANSRVTSIGYNTSATQDNTLLLGNTLTSTGIGTTAPTSKLEVVGATAYTVKSGVVAGTDNPDNTASYWVYSSGTGSITLPAASTCANRIYVLVNSTGAGRTISSYNNLAAVASTTLAAGTPITLVSDGTNWLQIR
jgi:hypothetical protein